MRLRNLFNPFSSDLAIDLGTANTLVYRQAGGLTRFASSRIHQSAWREDLWVRTARVLVAEDNIVNQRVAKGLLTNKVVIPNPRPELLNEMV